MACIKRVGGTIELKVDGELIETAGDFTYRLAEEQRTYGMNSDGSGYFTGAPTAGYIEGTVRNFPYRDVAALMRGECVEVTLKQGGKIVMARDAVFTGEGTVNATNGEIAVRWDSDRVREIAA